MALSEKAKSVLSDVTDSSALGEIKMTAKAIKRDHDLALELWATVLQRLFWYHQARLRWTGKGDPGNTAALLAAAEKDMASAHPDVQWTMNFCLGWIGIYEPEQRERCIRLGEQLGLYRDEVVAKNCTPSYLPEFIRIEVEKLALARKRGP